MRGRRGRAEDPGGRQLRGLYNQTGQLLIQPLTSSGSGQAPGALQTSLCYPVAVSECHQDYVTMPEP